MLVISLRPRIMGFLGSCIRRVPVKAAILLGGTARHIALAKVSTSGRPPRTVQDQSEEDGKSHNFIHGRAASSKTVKFIVLHSIRHQMLVMLEQLS